MDNTDSFIQINSPDGGFLQSEEWRKFQESVGRKTYVVSVNYFYASIIEHALPIVGRYFYVPRGPVVVEHGTWNMEQCLRKLIDLAKENNVGWVRVEPQDSRVLDLIRSNWRAVRAPHDMQPKELFIIDITKSEEQLLAEMKPKTRYNIRLAEKKEIKIFNFQFSIFNEFSSSNDQISKKYIDEFLRLTKVMAKRQGIAVHPEEYYQRMFETIPGEILKLYIAEHQGKVIAANLVIFFGDTCTYLHGASDDEYRNTMAPYLLQWRQVLDAKKAGCEKYDFGGINTRYKIQDTRYNSWAGITRFKLGFSPNTAPVTFPGSYDIIVNQSKYWTYRAIQKMKGWGR